LIAIELRWQERLGKETIGDLRESLERVVGEPAAQLSPLFRGLETRPGGWRASLRKPDTLPYFPMVLHRGGFPDGSSPQRYQLNHPSMNVLCGGDEQQCIFFNAKPWGKPQKGGQRQT
jgi:hypothetical protein